MQGGEKRETSGLESSLPWIAMFHPAPPMTAAAGARQRALAAAGVRTKTMSVETACLAS